MALEDGDDLGEGIDSTLRAQRLLGPAKRTRGDPDAAGLADAAEKGGRSLVLRPARDEAPLPPRSPRCAGNTSTRKRRYAWMDSGDEASSDEDGSEEEQDSGGQRAPQQEARPEDRGVMPEASCSSRRADERSAQKAKRDSDEELSVTEVSTFNQMLRLAPRLRRTIGAMRPAYLVEVIAAAARVRFYDVEFFDELLPEVRSRLRRRASNFTAHDMVECTASLHELNAYDAAIFSAVARELRSRLHELDTMQRRKLLAIFKSCNHHGDADFIAALVQREKHEAELLQSIRQAADYLVMRSPGQLRPGRL